MRILSIVCSCLLSLLLFAALPANANEKQKIIVGGDHENPPYEFLEDGKPTGFNVELMREVAKAIGVELEIRLAPWDDVRRELEQGKIDALAGMYYTEERRKLVDFSVPHTMVSAGLFVRGDSQIRTIEEIKGKEVIVQKGDVINDYLREKGIASRIIQVKDPADELRLLSSGRHDCALMPSRYQGEYLKKALGISDVRAMSVEIPQFRYCFAVKKGNDPLRFRLDEGLNILKLNGRYQEIYNKWFGVYEKRTLWRTVRYFVWALAVIAGLLAISSIWSWFLRREVRKRTAELRKSEEDLRHAHEDLEMQVKERTAELCRANESLEEEISVRNRTERVITARLHLLEFAATHSLDELLEATINEAEALTGSLIGFYHFLEADQETLSLQNWSTRTKAEFCRAQGKSIHYDISAAGVWVDCVRERKPVIHNDYASLPHRKGMPSDHADVIRELVLPVFRGDSIVAIIGVGNKPQDYTQEDVEAISFLADFAWEIVERKKAEEALRLSQFCIDKAGIGIYQSDENGAIFSVNEHACRSLGYSREELCSLSVFDIDPEITRERMLELKEMIDEVGTVTHHTTHRRRDGSTFPVEITANHLDFLGKRYGISFVNDITKRKKMEEALRDSESRVRRKLESILDPEGDIGELELADIIDAPEIQSLMDDLYRNTGLKMSIIDIKGRVLVDVGWQEICLRFHRMHPETLKKCNESDTDLTEGIPQGEFRAYRCRNNMWHLVTPIIVGGRHMGNLFMGQFFFDNEELDYDLFRSQAREYGFPEEEYMAALEAVPRYSEECVNKGKAFFLRLIDMFSRLSYGNIKLSHLLAERDRLTATLRESEALLKIAMDLAKLGAWEYDVGTGMFSFNDQFYGLYGTTAEREGGPLMPAEVYVRKFIPPEDSAVVANGIEAARTNSYFQVEHRIIRADGEERFIVVRGEAGFDQEGSFVKIRGANQDITERKRAEEEIRESRAKYQAIVDNFEGLIYICSQDYRVEFMNRKLIERTGYDATGEFCYRMMHDRDSICPWCVNERVFAGDTLHWEMFSPKDNHWYYVVNVPIPHADGTISKQSMMLDITDRKQAEEDLRKANMVVENSPVVLFRCKSAPGWPVELVSRNVVQFGYTPEEFLSGEITYSSIVYPRDMGKLIAETEQFAATGKGQWFQEYRIVTKWGDIRWIIDETVCERNGAGEITHYEGVIIDVTERRKAEEQLILQQLQLKELNCTLEERVRSEVAKNREKDVMLIQQNRQAALGEMLDHIAHQWKQPLNAIAIITYLLKDNDSLSMEEVNDTADKILGQVGHMSQTADLFRDFYRPDKEKSVFPIKESIDMAISILKPALQFEYIRVEVEADPKLAVLGYPKEFTQVMLNLLGNARDAFREKKVEKPVLNIKGRAEGNMAIITVTDNAGGICEEEIASIFDMNFTTKQASGGTGIGLYMAKNIIERHMGGELTAENVSDGARFSIRLGIAATGGNTRA
jgi:PAS domain S-box-containing protein